MFEHIILIHFVGMHCEYEPQYVGLCLGSLPPTPQLAAAEALVGDTQAH